MNIIFSDKSSIFVEKNFQKGKNAIQREFLFQKLPTSRSSAFVLQNCTRYVSYTHQYLYHREQVVRLQAHFIIIDNLYIVGPLLSQIRGFLHILQDFLTNQILCRKSHSM